MTNQKPLDIFEYTYEEREDLWNRIIKQPLDPKYLKQKEVGDTRVALFYSIMMCFTTANPYYAVVFFILFRFFSGKEIRSKEYGVYMAVEINYQVNRIPNMKDMRWCVRNDLPLNHDMKELFHEVCNYTTLKYMEPEKPLPIFFSMFMGTSFFVVFFLFFLWIVFGLFSQVHIADIWRENMFLRLFSINFYHILFTLPSGIVLLNVWLNDKSDFKKARWTYRKEMAFEDKMRLLYIEMLNTMHFYESWIKPHPSAMAIENGSTEAHAVAKNYEQQRHQYDLEIQELQNEIAEIWNNKRKGDDG